MKYLITESLGMMAFSSVNEDLIYSYWDICNKELTVASLSPPLASKTDFTTSLSRLGNISSTWNKNKM